MATIPIGLSFITWTGPATTLSTAPWISNVDAVFDVSVNRAGFISYKQTSAFPGFTQTNPAGSGAVPRCYLFKVNTAFTLADNLVGIITAPTTPTTTTPAAPTNLTTAARTANFTPTAGTVSADYEYRVDAASYIPLAGPVVLGTGQIQFTVTGILAGTLSVRRIAAGGNPVGTPATAAVAASRIALITIGDSLNAGIGATNPTTENPTAVIAAQNNWALLPNYALGGRTANDIRVEQLPQIIAYKNANAASYDVFLCFVGCGANDIRLSNTLLNTFTALAGIHADLNAAGIITIDYTLTALNGQYGSTGEARRQEISAWRRANWKNWGAKGSVALHEHPTVGVQVQPETAFDTTLFSVPEAPVHLTTAGYAIIAATLNPAAVGVVSNATMPGYTFGSVVPLPSSNPVPVYATAGIIEETAPSIQYTPNPATNADRFVDFSGYPTFFGTEESGALVADGSARLLQDEKMPGKARLYFTGTRAVLKSKIYPGACPVVVCVDGGVKTNVPTPAPAANGATVTLADSGVLTAGNHYIDVERAYGVSGFLTFAYWVVTA